MVNNKVSCQEAIEDAAGFIGIEPEKMKAAIDIYNRHIQASDQPVEKQRKCMICGYGRYCNNCVVNGDNHKAMFPPADQPVELREIPAFTKDSDYKTNYKNEFAIISIIGEAIRLAEGKADYGNYYLYCIAPKVFNALLSLLNKPKRESGEVEAMRHALKRLESWAKTAADQPAPWDTRQWVLSMIEFGLRGGKSPEARNDLADAEGGE